MSSKILSAADAALAQPIEWMAGSMPAAEPVRRSPLASPRPADNPPEDSVLQGHIQELERISAERVRDAFDQGQASGLAAGMERAQQQVEPVLRRLAASIEQLAGLRRKIRAEAEEDAVRLALAVARKILYREMSVDPEALLGLIKASLQRIDARELHRIRMHPEDIPAIERHLETLGMPARLEVVADPSLERGALLFETSRGQLDASIGTQLAEIERGFLDIVRRSRDAV